MRLPANRACARPNARAIPAHGGSRHGTPVRKSRPTTNDAGAKHRERALKEGASAFMVKPVQEDQFIAQVRELIGTSGQSIAAAVIEH